jgi:hypothetical protein
MKQFWFIVGGVVIAIAIACLFAGWVQLAMPPDTYGVIFTKSRGFEDMLVMPQGFLWRWERLIPGAFTLYRFSLQNQSADLSAEGMLPSGEVYASISPEKPDFSFEVRLSVLYRLRAETLPRLAAKDGLRPEGLSQYYATIDDAMNAKAASILLSDTSLGDAASLDIASVSALIQKDMSAAFPDIDFVSLAANVVKIPDLVLYGRLRETYLRITEARESSLADSASRQAAQELEQKAADQKQARTLSLLQQYGELLDKHPSLIKLLFLAGSKGFSAQDLTNLDILNKLDLTQ